MTFEEYLVLAGYITRVDATYYFRISDEELERRVKSGELLLDKAPTPYGDRFRLAQPDQITVRNFTNAFVIYKGNEGIVLLNRARPGTWKIVGFAKTEGMAFTTRQIQDLLGEKSW